MMQPPSLIELGPATEQRAPLTIRADLGRKATRPLRAQDLDPTWIYSAAITVSGPQMSAVAEATASVVEGQGQSVTINVPVGPNRVIEVQGLGRDGKLASPFAVVRGIATSPDDTSLVVNRVTTPAANVLLALRRSGSSLESTVDRLALQGFVNRLVYGGSGASGGRYVVHPALVDSAKLASYLLGSGGQMPPGTDGFALAGASVSGTVSGLIEGQTAQVSLDDPASDPVSTDASGNFTVAGVAPGTNLHLQVTNPYYTATSSVLASVATGSTTTGVNLALAGNYLDRSLWGGDICGLSSKAVVHFTQLPIRLLVITPSPANAKVLAFTSDHLQAVNDAITAYSNSFPGTLSFQLTQMQDDDPGLVAAIRRSDIYLYWVLNGLHTYCAGNGTVGCEEPFPPGGTITCPDQFTPVVSSSYQAAVQVTTQYVDGHPRPLREVYSVTEHELGHALGLSHSLNTQDLMYASVGYFGPNYTLSSGDIDTINFLYNLPANITRDHSAFDSVPVNQNPGLLSSPYPDVRFRGSSSLAVAD